MRIYCIHCNQPTDYELTKPKFCSSCASAFDKPTVKSDASDLNSLKEMLKRELLNELKTSTQKPTQTLKKQAYIVNQDDDDDIEDDLDPDSVKLDSNDISVTAAKSSKVTLKDLISSPANPQESLSPRKKLSKKEARELFKKEASGEKTSNEIE